MIYLLQAYFRGPKVLGVMPLGPNVAAEALQVASNVPADQVRGLTCRHLAGLGAFVHELSYCS